MGVRVPLLTGGYALAEAAAARAVGEAGREGESVTAKKPSPPQRAAARGRDAGPLELLRALAGSALPASSTVLAAAASARLQPPVKIGTRTQLYPFLLPPFAWLDRSFLLAASNHPRDHFDDQIFLLVADFTRSVDVKHPVAASARGSAGTGCRPFRAAPGARCPLAQAPQPFSPPQPRRERSLPLRVERDFTRIVLLHP